jgi:hypothetical protein
MFARSSIKKILHDRMHLGAGLEAGGPRFGAGLEAGGPEVLVPAWKAGDPRFGAGLESRRS